MRACYGLLLVALFLLPCRLAAKLGSGQGAIRSVVGTGQAGYDGDGQAASGARLREPFHVSFGPRGEMFVAEAANHCIRRVDAKTGRIATVAGCGRKGYSGDGGLATAATLNEPYGVVADARGNLFIVDRLNACIRRVDGKTGIITTVTGTGTPGYGGDGGPAAQAQLNEPNSVALDGQGALYIADVADNRIRRVDLKSGIITTVCGTGQRKFAGDGGIALAASIQGARAVDVDRAGNLYVCEREGNRIRKIEARTGTIQTIAGTGAEGYSGDNGPALKATFRGPKGIALDAKGRIYVVDTENHCIRRIDQQTGLITTIAGIGQRGNMGDGGPAQEAQLDRPHGCCVYKGTLYIADTNNHRIRVCSKAQTGMRVPAMQGSPPQMPGVLSTPGNMSPKSLATHCSNCAFSAPVMPNNNFSACCNACVITVF